MATIDDDSCDRSKQSKSRTSWTGFTILDAIKNICDSWKEVKISVWIGVWKKLIPILTDDFEGFKTLAEEVTPNVVERAGELELEVKPEDVTDLLQSYVVTKRWWGAFYGWAKKLVSLDDIYS